MDSKHKFGDDPTLEEPSLSSDKSRRSSLTEGKRGYRASFSSNAPRMPDLPGGDFLGLDADSVSTASTAQDADDYGPQDALMDGARRRGRGLSEVSLYEEPPDMRSSVSTRYLLSEAELFAKDWDLFNIDDVINALGFHRFQWRLFVLCGLGNFAAAFQTAMVPVLFPVLRDQWNLHTTQLAALGSSTYVGMFVGSILFGRFSDRSGRAPTFNLSLFMSSFFALVSGFGSSFNWFILWRFFLGVGYAGVMITDALLLAEYIPIRNRGRWLLLQDLFFAAGTIVCAFISSWVIPKWGWESMVIFSSIPGFVIMFFRRRISETPRFLLMRNEHGHMLALFHEIAAENEMPRVTASKIDQLKLHHGEEERGDEVVGSSYRKLFDFRLRVETIAMLMLWGLASAGGAMFLWLPLYLTETGSARTTHVLTENSYRATVYMAAGEVGVVCITSVIMGWMDRRNVLRLVFLAMGVSVMALGLMEASHQAIFNSLPVIGGFRSALTALLYVVTPELFPTSARGAAMGLCGAAGRAVPIMGYWFVRFLLRLKYVHVCGLFALAYFLGFFVCWALPFDPRNQPMAMNYYDGVKKDRGALLEKSYSNASRTINMQGDVPSVEDYGRPRRDSVDEDYL